MGAFLSLFFTVIPTTPTSSSASTPEATPKVEPKAKPQPDSSDSSSLDSLSSSDNESSLTSDSESDSTPVLDTKSQLLKNKGQKQGYEKPPEIVSGTGIILGNVQDEGIRTGSYWQSKMALYDQSDNLVFDLKLSELITMENGDSVNKIVRVHRVDTSSLYGFSTTDTLPPYMFVVAPSVMIGKIVIKAFTTNAGFNTVQLFLTSSDTLRIIYTSSVFGPGSIYTIIPPDTTVMASNDPIVPSTPYMQIYDTDVPCCDIPGLGHLSKSQSECETLCSSTPGCQGFIYVHDDYKGPVSNKNNCWLKNQTDRRAAVKGIVLNLNQSPLPAIDQSPPPAIDESPSPTIDQLPRYVKILQTLKNADNITKTCMNLGELKIYDKNNVQIDPHTVSVTQSSFYDSGTLPSSNLIDGNESTYAHTDCTTFPNWIMLDLGQSVDVSKFVIYNRKDCCKDRINGAQVIFINQNNEQVFTSDVISGSPDIITISPPSIVPVNSVSVISPSTPDIITISPPSIVPVNSVSVISPSTPKINTPPIPLPKVNLPKVNLPKVNLPFFSLPKSVALKNTPKPPVASLAASIPKVSINQTHMKAFKSLLKR